MAHERKRRRRKRKKDLSRSEIFILLSILIATLVADIHQSGQPGSVLCVLYFYWIKITSGFFLSLEKI
jgi:hypothetical protein